jgi:hypothetical protein
MAATIDLIRNVLNFAGNAQQAISRRFIEAQQNALAAERRLNNAKVGLNLR